MNVYNLKLYDELVNKTYINIYTLSKFKDGIYLNNFNPNDNCHRYFLQVARNVSTFENKPIFLDINLIAFWKFKLFSKEGKNTKRKKNLNKGINIDDVLDFMAKEIEVNKEVFELIFKDYWMPEKERRKYYND